MLVNILIIVGSLIALILIVALLMPKEYTISSSINIKRSQADVFNYVVNLRNQQYFSKWVMADPNAELTYKGTDGTVGFIAGWNSKDKNVGVGEQEITSIIPGERYDVELRFVKPFKATNHAFTTVKSISGNECEVTTTFWQRPRCP
ncbi:MAG: SRPBCC family protein [Crocinitomicaceae bacterium]|nr:SRPBCC family protein [Crocinitomicaceae bacterium]